MKLKNGSQVAARPSRVPTVGSPGYFSESNETGAPSHPGQDWFNDVIDELTQAVAAAGVTYDPSKITNLKSAVEALRNASNLNAGTVPIDRLPAGTSGGIDAAKLEGKNGEYYRNIANMTGNVPIERLPVTGSTTDAAEGKLLKVADGGVNCVVETDFSFNWDSGFDGEPGSLPQRLAQRDVGKLFYPLVSMHYSKDAEGVPIYDNKCILALPFNEDVRAFIRTRTDGLWSDDRYLYDSLHNPLSTYEDVESGLSEKSLVTPKSLKDAGIVNVQSRIFGDNQSNKVFVDRLMNTIYTNTTNKIKLITVTVNGTSGGHSYILVDGIEVARGNVGSYGDNQMFAVVPVGSTYEIKSTGGTPAITLLTEFSE
ncbi:MAG: hypothetical protein ACTH5B_15730 [Marinomonas sp.]|uniref:hypothetical protein n=1 Tax=Marinomonas sp. TaxID=1904862 RepID=UPI003F9E63A4